MIGDKTPPQKTALSYEDLVNLADKLSTMPRKSGRHANLRKMQLYSGSFAQGEVEQAILSDLLRVYAEEAIEISSVPIIQDLVENLLRRKDCVSPDAVKEVLRFQPEPILVAEHFYGTHKHEIVDGNHTYVAMALSVYMTQQDHSLPSDFEPACPGYVIPPEVWRDFLCILQPDGSVIPLNFQALKGRLGSKLETFFAQFE